MTAVDDLDYTPLGARMGARARLRAVASNPLMVMGATIGVLLVVVPVIVAIPFVVSGNVSDPGAAACLVMLVVGGLYVCWSVQHQSAKAGGFGLFATVNGLVWVHGTLATDYAASDLADGSHVVNQSVRTPGTDFLEVGDRFLVARPTLPQTAAVAAVGPGAMVGGRASPYRRPEVFLRARLAGGSVGDPSDGVRVTPQLRAAIEAFAGHHVVELTASELTVLGSRPLEVDDRTRVRTAFELIEQLAELNARSPRSTVAGGVDPVAAPPRRSALRIVLGVLALMVVVPIGFALVMSGLESVLPLRGNRALAGPVVIVVVGGLIAVVARVVRMLVAPRAGGGRRALRR